MKYCVPTAVLLNYFEFLAGKHSESSEKKTHIVLFCFGRTHFLLKQCVQIVCWKPICYSAVRLWFWWELLEADLILVINNSSKPNT